MKLFNCCSNTTNDVVNPAQIAENFRHLDIVVRSQDFVYGIGQQRADFVRDLRSAHPQQVLAHIEEVHVNTYLDDFLATGEGGFSYGSNEYVQDNTYNTGHSPVTGTAQYIKAFMEGHECYDPRNIPSVQHQRVRTARGCKAITELTVTNNHSIYFVLDGINEKNIVKKEKNTPSARRPTTGKELRHIFRNWQNPVVNQGVKFIKNGQQVPAPWETNPSLWSAYKPKHLYTDMRASAAT